MHRFFDTSNILFYQHELATLLCKQIYFEFNLLEKARTYYEMQISDVLLMCCQENDNRGGVDC